MPSCSKRCITCCQTEGTIRRRLARPTSWKEALIAYDEALEEVHRVKDALAKKHGYDLRRTGRALRAAQKRRGRKVVSLAPRRPRPAAPDRSRAA